MQLKAHWRNAQVHTNERERAENTLEEYLLNHFGNASVAFNTKHNFNTTHRQPNHPWNIGVTKGIGLATRGMSPSACAGMKWDILFFDD